MRLIIKIILILLIIFIMSFTGCINNKNDSNKKSKDYLEIEIKNVNLTNNTKNLELLNFTIMIDDYYWNSSYLKLKKTHFYKEINTQSNLSFNINIFYTNNKIFLIGNKNNIKGFADYNNNNLNVKLKNFDPINITLKIDPESYTGNSYLINTTGIDGSLEINIKIIKPPN